MNKMTKGAIAGGAGIVLLLGGAGSFALWSNSTGVSGGEIATGTLTIEQDGTPVWTDISPDVNGGAGVSINDSFLMVPGDVVTYSQDFTIEGSGNNLLASFSYDYEQGDLPDGVSAVAAVSVDGGTATTSPVEVEPGETATVVITVRFDVNTAGTTSQNAPIDLSDFTATVTQVRPAP